MNFSQRRIIQAIVGCVVVFIIAAFVAVRYGDGLTPTLLGIVGTALTPTIGALITLLIVTPLRNQQNKNGEAIARVEVKVNGQMDALRKEARETNAALAAMVEKNAELTTRAITTTEDAKRAALLAQNELSRVKEQLRRIQDIDGGNPS